MERPRLYYEKPIEIIREETKITHNSNSIFCTALCLYGRGLLFICRETTSERIDEDHICEVLKGAFHRAYVFDCLQGEIPVFVAALRGKDDPTCYLIYKGIDIETLKKLNTLDIIKWASENQEKAEIRCDVKPNRRERKLIDVLP